MKTTLTQVMGMAVAMLLLLASSVTGEEWGTIKGRFVLVGDAPAVKPINPGRITDVFCQEVNKNNPLVEEEWVVNGEKQVRNVVLYLTPPRGKEVPVHPDYEATAKDVLKMDNKDCRFMPHVLAMRVSQTLEIANSDETAHNSQLSPQKSMPINPQIAAGGSVKYNFKFEEPLPVEVKCNAHNWMKGWILVRDNPYFAISGEDGTFEIKNIPVGEHSFRLKHADTKYGSELIVDGKPIKLAKGEWKLKIEAGEKDLGDIQVKF